MIDKDPFGDSYVMLYFVVTEPMKVYMVIYYLPLFTFSVFITVTTVGVEIRVTVNMVTHVIVSCHHLWFVCLAKLNVVYAWVA